MTSRWRFLGVPKSALWKSTGATAILLSLLTRNEHSWLEMTSGAVESASVEDVRQLAK
jgi:hypothetical protein